ncbi:ABC transporter permease [Limisphaera ngatamarikiensis]|jgi:ABC-2 type transport system permease protein|uniref:ABC transporter permease n=1 Tax=Limisphaera ngatamarikiensis TaxID=1324935 RepID=A0A6M1RPC5_9BACT|nr:ABC transporter permease [Limisphaera ngatamarikiensis]NGO39513.1 ABC transporter permease [Limisphaera ngatamarikiensis]
MTAFWVLFRRELAAYLVSLSGWVIMAAVAFLVGLSFVDLLLAVRQTPLPVHVTEVFYQTPYFWMVVLLSGPVITMRLFAQERASGTYETLMTSPVRDGTVVAAKFGAAWVFYLLVWLPLPGCVTLIRYWTGEAQALEWPLLGSTYLGIGLLGALFLSMGCFASALTRSQTVAAMVGGLLAVSLFLAGFAVSDRGSESSWWVQVLGAFALVDHMRDFTRGVVDLRPVVLYASTSLAFLYLTLRAVEGRHWK